MATAMKKNISVIPAMPAYDRTIRPQMKTLRVAAYCRVSILQEQQETSYEAQVSYYTEKSRAIPTGSWLEFSRTMGKAQRPRKNALIFRR